MELTESWRAVVPAALHERYNFYETRNAAAVLAAAAPEEFADLVTVLDEFALLDDDLLAAGGNESVLAARLNHAFRARDWREARVDSTFRLDLVLQPWAGAGETRPRVTSSEAASPGYLVDNWHGRVALDVEWNAKDGNLDRDLAAYRVVYDAALVDAAVIITREHDGLREFAWDLRRRAGMDETEARRFLTTTTTTNMTKLKPRMARGDAGGCPLLAVAICERTWKPEASSVAVPEPAAGLFDSVGPQP